ncbi:hypothetical protein BYT27DRAFT_7224360 [Phlegmacium glaucopus]|nr:hypothetical protein BYT27DRAFT_7224360 [Phlegmacium glaucopus]
MGSWASSVFLGTRLRLSTSPIITDALEFVNGFTPVPKRRKVCQFKASNITNIQNTRILKEEEQRNRKEEEDNLNQVLKFIEGAGYPTLLSFITALIMTKDPIWSSQVSHMFIHHGHSILDSIHQCQPQVANDWAISTVCQLVATEGEHLTQCFQPEQKTPVSEILKQFSIAKFLSEAEVLAPSTCQVLQQIGFPESSSTKSCKKQELVLAMTICMLAKACNDHATEFQTLMGMYFMKIAKSRAFMLIWDNLNIVFKDHFDNGTTAMLIPLYSVEFAVLNFGPEDLLPSREEAQCVQAGQLWHIKDILYDTFSVLRKCLASSIIPPLPVHQILVHKTEQYPLPAMHIDESSLKGTLGVMNTIFQSMLELTEDDVKGHGLVICAGDQLSLALLDKISAIQHDNSNFMDNVGLYMEGQDGLLHIKFSHTQMIANEFWGTPNSKSPWSLWKINTLLGRKAISAGWKAKSLPPFHPVYELTLNLTLPANILDGFCIYSPLEKLEDWVDTIEMVEEVDLVVEKVLNELCSGHHVPFKNICLFNRDCLYLQQLEYAIKCGDVGTVLDVITHSMLAFWGTGKTPKYADALIQFGEMDLLQEHQNFWNKVIYNAKGSNHTWTWLAMVSVCIFALRDVIFKMQKYTSHTSPSTETDIKILCDYLEAQHLQTYYPECENNSSATKAQDLIQVGSEYANTSSAFQNCHSK